MQNMFASPVFIRVLPFALYIGFLILEGALRDAGLGLDVRWLYPVKAGLVALALVVLWRHYHELHRWGMRAGALLGSVLIGVVIFVLWINLAEGWMLLGDMGAGYRPLDASGQLDWRLIALRIAGAALVVPVMEELFWRSFLQRWVQQQDFIALEPARIGFKALFIASTLFAVEHTQWFAGLLAGLAYGWLYVRTGNLWAPIISHAVTNGLLGVYVVATSNWQFW